MKKIFRIDKSNASGEWFRGWLLAETDAEALADARRLAEICARLGAPSEWEVAV